MTPTIRPAAAEDEDAVVALWRACGLVVSYNDPAADFRFARAGGASDVLVGTVGNGLADGDRIVASVMVGHDGHRGWLWYVAVDPGLRGAGAGRAMVAAAETWLRDRGVAKVHLLVRETNTGVVAFYEQQGFEVAPRVMMAKWLNGPP